MSTKRKNVPVDSNLANKRQAPVTRSSSPWKHKGTSLIYRRTKTEGTSNKAACFDLDGTLVKTKGMSPFARTADDWTFFNGTVVTKLQSLHSEGYNIIIFSNQGGIKSSLSGPQATKHKNRIDQIIEEIDIPVAVYLSTMKDTFRKPETGMWDSFLELQKLDDIDKSLSFFVGDAAGRPSDFSDSDLKFAENVGIRFFTPEDFFVDEGDTSKQQEDEEVKSSA